MSSSIENQSGIAHNGIASLLRRFRLKEVLSEDTGSKTIWLLGTISSDLHEKDARGDSSGAGSATSTELIPGVNAAVVTLERLAFISHDISCAKPTLLDSAELMTSETNDVYSWATGTLHESVFQPDVRVAVIYPATQKHIDKHRRQERLWINETPEQYARITKTFIESQPASRIQWVYNILAKHVESERIVFEDTNPENGFIILPDLKWDVSNPDSMYLVAIVHRRDIRSLRDLESHHLPLLKNLRTKSAAAAQVYGVSADKLRLYVHYQPSYYHFHVHITNVDFEAKGMLAERAHLLDSIIDNIENIAPDYYQRATLPFALGSSSDLWKYWAEHANV